LLYRGGDRIQTYFTQERPFLGPCWSFGDAQLYRMARQLAGPEGADDIVQDTFLRTPEGRLQTVATLDDGS